LNTEGFPDHLRGPWSKLRGYCGRLALILHELWLAVEGKPSEVPVEGIRISQAAELIRYFKSHRRKVSAAMEADPRVADARRVLACLARHRDHEDFRTAFPRTAVYRRLRGYFKRPDALDAPLRLLVDHQFLRCSIPDREGRRGHNPEL
jgi:hypothetical protein